MHVPRQRRLSSLAPWISGLQPAFKRRPWAPVPLWSFYEGVSHTSEAHTHTGRWAVGEKGGDADMHMHHALPAQPPRNHHYAPPTTGEKGSPALFLARAPGLAPLAGAGPASPPGTPCRPSGEASGLAPRPAPRPWPSRTTTSSWEEGLLVTEQGAGYRSGAVRRALPRLAPLRQARGGCWLPVRAGQGDWVPRDWEASSTDNATQGAGRRQMQECREGGQGSREQGWGRGLGEVKELGAPM